MFSNLKVYKCGAFYRIISINLKTSSGIASKLHKIENDKKLLNNLVRAKTNIQNLALCNDFKYFVTITFKPTYDRFDLDLLKSKFKYTIKLLREACCIDIKYLVVPEQHKSGAWHFHCFFSDITDCLYYNDYGYLDCDYFNLLGHCNFQLIQNIQKCSNYVTKYISKNLGDGVKKFKHSYFVSKNLDRPYLTDDYIYNNSFFDEHFFDFKNDYCRIKVVSEEDYYNIKHLIKKC